MLEPLAAEPSAEAQRTSGLSPDTNERLETPKRDLEPLSCYSYAASTTSRTVYAATITSMVGAVALSEWLVLVRKSPRVPW